MCGVKDTPSKAYDEISSIKCGKGDIENSSFETINDNEGIAVVSANKQGLNKRRESVLESLSHSKQLIFNKWLEENRFSR